ncbi:MAG: hypothetical protein IJG25_07540 [Thermoguttaceae bacterium]|nr:hypothetical protein [Thermoguttaceae bacterium]
MTAVMTPQEQIRRFFRALLSSAAACWTLVLSFLAAPLLAERPVPDLLGDRQALRTIYQQAGGYSPRYDIKADGVMVYGVDEAAVAGYDQWRRKSGSIVRAMTGVAWGNYDDYLGGDWDGVDHWDDAQVDANGDRVLHRPGAVGDLVLHGPDFPYLCPSISFCDYMIERLKKAVDAGVDSICLEEPEFWAFSGFGESFKRQWRTYYTEDPMRPDETCDAQFRAGVLKAYLFGRALERISSALKQYALQRYDRELTFLVATHSLLSYTQTRIVSPESALIDLPGIDGLIAQVWTGTSRAPNIYHGQFRERTFEAAMLEYSVMSEMVRGTGKRIYFLSDPIEDDPRHDWTDYRRNYLCTLTASLMRSATADYQVVPWPSRVFLEKFPAGSPEATGIPDDYATILNIVFQQLRDMDQQELSWNGATEGIGVFLSDSAMFQRGFPDLYRDASGGVLDRGLPTYDERFWLGGFFALTLPLLKAGIPVEVPVLDRVVRCPGYLDPYKVLILSYEFQKPLTPAIHAELANWVRGGGVLVYIGTGSDPFHEARGWWNDNPADTVKRCDKALFRSLGLPPDLQPGTYPVGRGTLIFDKTEPAYYDRSKESAEEYRALIAGAAKTASLDNWVERGWFLKTRGPYILASGLDERDEEPPLTLRGRYVDLFDAALPILTEVTVPPGTQRWLLDLDRVSGPDAMPLACAGRIDRWQSGDNGVTCTIAACAGITVAARWRLPQKPSEITVGGRRVDNLTWDEESRTVYFRYANDTAEQQEVTVTY